MHRRDLLLAGVLAFTAPRQTAAQDFTPLGAFDNVRVSSATGEAHCYGYSLELWRHRGTIIGLLDRHNGLCGDPPCEALANVSHDPRSGRLDFSALSVTFVGTLRRDDVVGTLDGKRIRLVRDKDQPPIDSDRDESLDAWCDFWRGVRRCRGVDDLCRSLSSEQR